MQLNSLDNSVNILPKNECTGCSVCYNICPYNAIEMIETKEGFHYPIIDKEKCTNCGLCVKKCHSLNPDRIKMDFNQEKYDVRANDEIRMKSSSGGMFTVIANYVLENGGYVCGVAFTEDWLGVEHIIINDKKDLYKLRGSKYIESELVGNIFKDIKKLLDNDCLVLFTGTPCQVAALNSFLLKNYDNLITVDILCNSVLPQKVWKKYLREKFTDEDIKNIEYISFRDKAKFGWGAGIYIKFKYGEFISKDYEEIYMKLFGSKIGVKEECFYCKYRSLQRISDISIGDHWKVKNEDENGVSLVLINSIKGKEIFDKIKNNTVYKTVDNLGIVGGLNATIKFSNARKYFFNHLDSDKTLSYISSNRFDAALIGLPFAKNYGAYLTYYALYEILENFGLSVLVLDLLGIYFRNNNTKDRIAFKKGIDFASKYYKNILPLDDDSIKKCDMFIDASDQLWNKNHTWLKHKKYTFFFDFLTNDKKKIAISTSYGDDDDNLFMDYNMHFIGYYLSQFDYISLREKDASDFINKTFNLKTETILDPVFLLDSKEYNYLISNRNFTDDNTENDDYIFCYLYDRKIIEKIKEFSQKINKKLKYTTFKEEPEQWLYLMKNASFVITDGFHGSCFSIIFNKPFVCINNNYYHSSLHRVRNLFELFNLEYRLLPCFDMLEDNINLFLNLDYSNINKKLEIERERSLNWIKNALESPKKYDKSSFKYNMINYLINENNEIKKIYNNLQKQNDSIKDMIQKQNDSIKDMIQKEDIFIKSNINMIRLFGIYNTKDYIFIYIFGIKITLKKNEKTLNRIAWWIPFKKKRDEFRNKFK